MITFHVLQYQHTCGRWIHFFGVCISVIIPFKNAMAAFCIANAFEFFLDTLKAEFDTLRVLSALLESKTICSFLNGMYQIVEYFWIFDDNFCFSSFSIFFYLFLSVVLLLSGLQCHPVLFSMHRLISFLYIHFSLGMFLWKGK